MDLRARTVTVDSDPSNSNHPLSTIMSCDELATPSEVVHNDRDYFAYGQSVGNSESLLNAHVQSSSNGAMTSKNPPKNLWRIIACVFWNFSQGFSDSAPGAILPFIEAYYGVNYAVVSLIWISNAIGYILIASLSHKIDPWLGKQKSFAMTCCFSIIMYSLVSSGTKFPVIVLGFFCGGMGSAIGNSQSNIFLVRLQNESKYLSIHHGFYGIGATISPLVATAAINAGLKWNYFYLVLLSFSVINLLNLFFSFKGADIDLKPWETDQTNPIAPADTPIGTVSDELEMSFLTRALNTSHKPLSVTSERHSDNMIAALKSPITWYLCLFLLFYQGAEVSMGGWIVTFLLDYRHGNPNSVGYVASGFWGGLTIGRLFLVRPLHKLLGTRRSIILISLGSISLVALSWAIPHVLPAAILISLAGVLIGPNYPLMITYTSIEGLIPRKIQIITLTIMTAFGSSGGALFPFLVGLLSQKVGTYVVLPVFIALYSAMLFLWICLPSIEKRKKYPIRRLSKWERFW
jgi:fucose permease